MLRSKCAAIALVLTWTSAAAESYVVSGTLDRFDIWHFASDLRRVDCSPEAPCHEADFPAESLIGPAPELMSIPVTGQLVVAGGVVKKLSLRQTAPVALAVESAWEPTNNRIHIDGLSWELKKGMLKQSSAAVVTCEEEAGQGCRAVSMTIRDPANRESPLDFDGIPQDFPIQNGSLFLEAHPAFAAELSDLSNISVNVSAHAPVKGKWPGMYNAASLAHFTLSIEARVPPEPNGKPAN